MEKHTRGVRFRRRVGTMVTRDGLIVRRLPRPLSAPQAERIVTAMNHLPTILEAWTQRAGRGPRRIVCWLPATPRAHETMRQAFYVAEAARAWTEGVDFIWSPTVFGSQVRCCYNPRSRRAYLVTRLDAGKVVCQCPRFAAAGTCKHAIDALVRSRFATGAK